MQQKLGVRPDLTALGKGIAGGLPFGAFGGREDVMGVFDPSHGAPDVYHPGTFNANSLSLAAAVALLDQLTVESFARANSAGERLRELVASELGAAGLTSTVSGVGPVSSVHFGIQEVRNARDVWKRNPTALYCFFLALLNRGVYMAPRGFFCVSLALEDDDITEIGRVVGDVAQLMAAGDR
jgi:glutamate-1-semialdehyde 2,1-aminomutase